MRVRSAWVRAGDSPGLSSEGLPAEEFACSGFLVVDPLGRTYGEEIVPKISARISARR